MTLRRMMIGATAASSDSYQLRINGTGTPLITDTNSAQAISQPSYSSGDLLVVCACFYNQGSGTASLFDPGGNWNSISKSNTTNNSIGIWARIATGDANDDATLAGKSAGIVQIAQMAAFHGNVWSPLTNNDIVVATEATTHNGTSTTMDYPANGGSSFTKTLALVASCKKIDAGTEGPATNINETGFNLLASHVSNLGNFDMLMAWSWRYNDGTSASFGGGSWPNSTGSSLRYDAITTHFKSLDT